MDRNELAEKLYYAACLAQAGRMQSDGAKKRGDKPLKEDVCCEFKDLFENAKSHYLAMADSVLEHFVLKTS